MADVKLSNAAKDKLLAIHKYIVEEFHSPIAADNTVGSIFDTLERLERFPDSGPLLSSIHHRIPARFTSTRFLTFGNYIAIYDHNGDDVLVLQVYHGSEDYIRHLLRHSF